MTSIEIKKGSTEIVEVIELEPGNFFENSQQHLCLVLKDRKIVDLLTNNVTNYGGGIFGTKVNKVSINYI